MLLGGGMENASAVGLFEKKNFAFFFGGGEVAKFWWGISPHLKWPPGNPARRPQAQHGQCMGYGGELVFGVSILN